MSCHIHSWIFNATSILILLLFCILLIKVADWQRFYSYSIIHSFINNIQVEALRLKIPFSITQTFSIIESVNDSGPMSLHFNIKKHFEYIIKKKEFVQFWNSNFERGCTIVRRGWKSLPKLVIIQTIPALLENNNKSMKFSDLLRFLIVVFQKIEIVKWCCIVVSFPFRLQYRIFIEFQYSNKSIIIFEASKYNDYNI